jgi:thiamine biosynthesis lipoprotein
MALLSLGLESPAQSAMTFVHKKKYAMGTVFEIVAYDASLERASRAVEQAFDEVVRFDRMMSNYAPDSELSRLNSSAGFSTQTVSPELYRIIEESLKYSRLSGGKFDVTVGPLVDLWKAAMLGNAPPSAGQEADARACVGYDKVQLIAPNRIAFRSACLRIDLGGIGKGYAVDRAAEVLRSNRIKAALIDAGGSTIYAMGSPPGETGWAVHMRDPSRKVDPTTMLSDASISTSEQTPPSLLANSSAGHIIDPGSGIPLRTRFAVSVVAKTATASDALSTTLLLEGPQEGGSMLQKIRGMAAIWIAPDGESYTVSSGPMIVTGPKLRSVAKQPGSQAQAAVVSKN